MADKNKVVVKCGPIEEVGYVGVADPTLDVVFLQSPEEEAKYSPIMQQLVENGLDTEGTSISGI